jgi:hypothetical protein
MEDGYYGSIDEARSRYQMESDREFGLRAQQNKMTAQRIAIEKGTAAANAWYQRAQIALAKDKFKEDIRQFDLQFGEGQRQFDISAFGIDKDGRPTLSREKLLSDLTGMYQGKNTWERQYQTAGLTGFLDGQSTLDRERLGLEQARFGDDSLYRWTNAALEARKRPQDWIGYKRLTSGVAGLPGGIPGLNYGANQHGYATWQGGNQTGNVTVGADPTPASIGDTLGALGQGGQANVGAVGQMPANGNMAGNWALQAAQGIANAPLNLSADEQQVYNTAREFSRNPHGAGIGWWEQQDPMTKELIQGASEDLGNDFATVMSRYKRSRWGAGAGGGVNAA